MTYSSRIIVGLTLASFLFAAPVGAQGPVEGEGSMQVGSGTTVSVGGGTAILDLPDVQFLKKIPVFALGQTVSSRITDADDFSDEIGWNINVAISSPLVGNRAISMSGFWANIKDKDTAECLNIGGSCLVHKLTVNPTATNIVQPAAGATSRTERDVDQVGIALEVKQNLTPGVMGVTKAPNARYLAVGADWRAIYQDMELSIRDRLNPPTPNFNPRYNEDLDTNYYGVFAAFGGDYSPFLLRGLWELWGLQSSFRLQGGVYYADSDYSGSLRDTFAPVALNSDATDSNSEIAFIGALTLETRKRIGRQATLSLKSDYEYYSYVPEMKYNDTINGGILNGPNVGTTIGNTDAYAIRTSLRLTIKLGPDELF